MTNSIRPGRPASLPEKGEARKEPVALRGCVLKRRQGSVRWLETECSEGQTREAGRPGWQEGRCSYAYSWRRCAGRGRRRAGHSGVRASIVALKPGNAGGAKGRRKVDEG